MTLKERMDKKVLEQRAKDEEVKEETIAKEAELVWEVFEKHFDEVPGRILIDRGRYRISVKLCLDGLQYSLLDSNSTQPLEFAFKVKHPAETIAAALPLAKQQGIQVEAVPEKTWLFIYTPTSLSK